MESASHPKLRVLLLEDSDLVRTTMHQLLTEKGFEVFSYPGPASCPLHTAEHCRCAAAEACADVLVTDLDMPQISGLEFIQELMHKGCKIHHLAMFSGSHDQAALARTAGLHCKVFAKPGELLALLDWLDEVQAALRPERQLTPSLP